MLVGLTVFCLMVPRYWRHDARTADAPAQPSPIHDGNNERHRPSVAAEVPPFGVSRPHLPFDIIGSRGPGMSFPDPSCADQRIALAVGDADDRRADRSQDRHPAR